MRGENLTIFAVVTKDIKMSERMERALAVAAQLYPGRPPPTMDLPADFIEHALGHLFGDIWTRPALSVKLRSLVTAVTCAALGRNVETEMHLTGALGVGWTEAELREAITQVGYYAGFPTAVEGHRILTHLVSGPAADGLGG